MEGIIAVFDFDKTIIDVDSDYWVVDELGFTDLFNQLLPTMPLNFVMERMMKAMHEQGVTINDITRVLQKITIHPRVIHAIKSAHAAGCDLRILSDANDYFIETVLNHLGIRSCFSEIITNPGYVDNKQGRLRIEPYYNDKTPHGCNLCPTNLCKGKAIEKLLAEDGSTKKLIYLGDGSGDYCPSLKLRAGDFMMPRKNFPAYDLIASNPKVVRAEVHDWADGDEFETVLLRLVDATSAARLYTTVDCKFQTILPMGSKALPVLH